MKALRSYSWAPGVVAIGLVTAWTVLCADAFARRDTGIEDWGTHFSGGLVLYCFAGLCFGLLLAASVALCRSAEALTSQRWPRVGKALTPILAGAASAALAAPTAVWMFGGAGIQQSTIASWGPYAVIAAAAFGGAVAAALLSSSLASARRGRLLLPLAVACAAIGVAAVLVRVDLTMYVSLYSRLHAALEATAALCIALAVTLIAVIAVERQPGLTRGVATGIAGLGTLVAIGYVAASPVRAWTEDALRYTWREPVYVGRMLSRVQLAESFVRDPKGWSDSTMSGVVKLRRKYDIATTTRGPEWDVPLQEPPWFAEKIRALRGERDFNILVYYVDTLRADVAADPATMPNVVRFANESLEFKTAYSTGSDTLHALPGLINGNFDLYDSNPNNVLTTAENAGMSTVFVGAKSAREFLGKLLPSFRFGETLEVSDYQRGNEKVWGYGADQPTARRIVDRALEWMQRHRTERFFAWMFNFDVHNWRELDEAYVRDAARQYSVPENAPLSWRYRVVARALDAQFERLLDGLEVLGLSDRTIVLFVSDHGEGLGRNGFWVHSVFLWESLVRVPLVLRVPGLAPSQIDDCVSLVDVAPTLSRYIVKDAEGLGYQGEDLLGYLVPDRPARRLPILLAGTSKEKLVRLGIIDAEAPYKLVLPLESAVPELYDLAADDPDADDVAPRNGPETLKLLSRLVRAPLFPRLTEPAGAAKQEQHAALSSR